MSSEVTEPVANGLAIWDGNQPRTLNNFDGDERQKFALQMLCLAASTAGDDALGREIAVKYWMVHEVDFENEETGEIVRTFRTVLVTPANETFSFVSQGVAKGIQQVHATFGTKPLDPALKFKVVQKTTSKKRRVYVLVPTGF